MPIYLPDGGYIEQLGYETIQCSTNPTWQSSIRPRSQTAFDYIVNAAGIQMPPEKLESVADLNEKLKTAIRECFVDSNTAAIYRIESLVTAIGRATDISDN